MTVYFLFYLKSNEEFIYGFIFEVKNKRNLKKKNTVQVDLFVDY